MELRKASRKRSKLQIGISGPAGFGKSYGALLVAKGLAGSWDKIAVIDTENGSADLYDHLGDYNVITLKPPFSPERYIEAIKTCEKAGMEVIIIDSVTHVWKGEGGLLEFQNKLGGRYQDWAKTTPLYQRWLQTILQSSSHIITTIRKKQAYSMSTENGKTKVDKIGMDDEIREGFEYELTIAFEIMNDKHFAKASKDRTSIFNGKEGFILNEEVGKKILEWHLDAKEEVVKELVEPKEIDQVEIDKFLFSISLVSNIEELTQLYKNTPDQIKTALKEKFAKKGTELKNKANEKVPV